MINLAELLTLSELYSAATGAEEKTVSSRVFSDSKKLTALREGADITTGRFNAAIRWFDANWPDGAEWPSHILRPIIGERFDAMDIGRKAVSA
jgi:hypothetical protein